MYKGLSNDSKLMYDLCTGIADGSIEKVKDRRIGKVSSARWITFGARFVHYCNQAESSNFEDLLQVFII